MTICSHCSSCQTASGSSTITTWRLRAGANCPSPSQKARLAVPIVWATEPSKWKTCLVPRAVEGVCTSSCCHHWWPQSPGLEHPALIGRSEGRPGPKHGGGGAVLPGLGHNSCCCQILSWLVGEPRTQFGWCSTHSAGTVAAETLLSRRTRLLLSCAVTMAAAECGCSCCCARKYYVR